MKTYRVVWTIEVEASNPVEAAREALNIQQDEGSEALYFEVLDPNSNEVIAVVDIMEVGKGSDLPPTIK